MLCQNCSSRDFCQSACPELQLHLYEIEGKQNHLNVSINIIENPRRIEYPSGVELTKTEKKILTMLLEGFSKIGVCETLNITRHNLNVRLSKMKEKMPNF